MSGHIKGDERLTVHLQTESPETALLCDIHSKGTLRARFRPKAVSNWNPQELNGMLLVIKHNQQKELYRGISAIKNESIESALRRYLQQSEQVDSALKLVVEQNEKGAITAAFGVILERLPPVPDLPEMTPEAFYQKYGAITSLSGRQLSSEMQAGELLGHALHPLQTKRLKWECRCSMERIESMLISLGPKELTQIIEDDGKAEVVCDYCNTAYRLTKADLNRLLNDIQ